MTTIPDGAAYHAIPDERTLMTGGPSPGEEVGRYSADGVCLARRRGAVGAGVSTAGGADAGPSSLSMKVRCGAVVTVPITDE